VLKISSNSRIYRLMNDNIDMDAGVIMEGTATIESVGEALFREIIEVASGKPTKAELLGHGEFAIHSMGLNV